jgi:putative oxidoreductase
MTMAISSDIKHQHPGVLLLRYTVSLLMLFHGAAKLTGGVGPIEGLLEQVGLPAWLSIGVYIGEIVAPLLVMAGLWVRWAALLMAINMLFAIGLAHLDDLFALTQTGAYRLEAQAFFLFCSLSIAWLAGGKFAPARSRGGF